MSSHIALEPGSITVPMSYAYSRRSSHGVWRVAEPGLCVGVIEPDSGPVPHGTMVLASSGTVVQLSHTLFRCENLKKITR